MCDLYQFRNHDSQSHMSISRLWAKGPALVAYFLVCDSHISDVAIYCGIGFRLIYTGEVRYKLENAPAALWP